jgi:hypothetical protein
VRGDVAGEDRAGGAEGVAERERAAVGVEPRRIEVEVALEPQAQGGERLGELDHREVARGEPGAGQHLDDRRLPGGQHRDRIGGDAGGATTRAIGARPWRAAAAAVPITKSAAASARGGDDARV